MMLRHCVDCMALHIHCDLNPQIVFKRLVEDNCWNIFPYGYCKAAVTRHVMPCFISNMMLNNCLLYRRESLGLLPFIQCCLMEHHTPLYIFSEHRIPSTICRWEYFLYYIKIAHVGVNNFSEEHEWNRSVFSAVMTARATCPITIQRDNETNQASSLGCVNKVLLVPHSEPICEQ